MDYSGMSQAIAVLMKEFEFRIEIDPKDSRIMFLRFDDGRAYRLQHPGTLAAIELFVDEEQHIQHNCLKYFISNCIQPFADDKTKVLDNETMDIDEGFDLWLDFAWRWLRRGHKLVM